MMPGKSSSSSVTRTSASSSTCRLISRSPSCFTNPVLRRAMRLSAVFSSSSIRATSTSSRSISRAMARSSVPTSSSSSRSSTSRVICSSTLSRVKSAPVRTSSSSSAIPLKKSIVTSTGRRITNRSSNSSCVWCPTSGELYPLPPQVAVTLRTQMQTMVPNPLLPSSLARSSTTNRSA